MAEKNYYIKASEMLDEWMKIYYWHLLDYAEPCDYTTLLVSLSGEKGLDYTTDVLALSGNASEKLGEYFKKIAIKTSTSPCFVNYSFRDDMIGDALLNMIRYYDRFNPLKSKNIFSYFTRIACNAFIVRIKKEERSRNTISDFQSENFPRLMLEQTEGKCGVHLNPEQTIEETLTFIEKEIQKEDDEWN